MYGVRYKGTIQTEQLTVGMCLGFINQHKDEGDIGWLDSPHWAIIERSTGYEIQPQMVLPVEPTIHDHKQTLKRLIADLETMASSEEGDKTLLFVTISQLKQASRDLYRFISRQPLGVVE